MKQAYAQLLASDGAAFDTMGASAGISNETAVTGAPASTTPGTA